jgi:translocator protein
MSRSTRRHLAATTGAVAATAVIGALGTDVRSTWYRRLAKPAWQPPGAAFGPVWTGLYALIALGSAWALDRTDDPDERRTLICALGTNLVLNASWNWLFFKGRRPQWALAEIALLEASTLDLARRASNVDPAAGRILMPYAAWVGYASALNAAIVRLNPQED